MSRRTVFYLVGMAGFFAIGAYAWKIVNTGRNTVRAESVGSGENRQFPARATLVYVGDIPITTEDINWEYSVHTSGIVEGEELTSIPDLGGSVDEVLAPLKERLLAGMVERKLLYTFLQQDPHFNMADPGLYMECLKEWQETIDTGNELVTSAKDRERLKNRLCERSILNKYLADRIYPRIKISENELKEYYQNHKAEFEQPERIVLRQVVLASEGDAKKVMGRINRDNFTQIAETESISPESEDGGRLGPFAKGELPSVFDVAFSMRPHEIRGILKSTYGFHVIMLEKKLPSVKLGLDEAKPKIEAILRKKKEEEEYQKWVESALNAIPVKTPKPLW